MSDYKKMYTTLFNAITDAIHILQKAQQSVEETYISKGDSILALGASDSTDEGNTNKKRTVTFLK